MLKVLLIVFFGLCPVLHAIHGEVPPAPPDGGCWVQNTQSAGEVLMRCVKLGIDGRSLEQVIGNGSIVFFESNTGRHVNETSFRNVSISDISNLVRVMALDDSRIVNLGENALSRFPNLNILRISGPDARSNESVVDEDRARLTLAPGVFRYASRLDHLGILRMNLSDESIRVLLELKEQIVKIGITDLWPQDRVFTTLAQYTNLTYMGFFNCCSRHPFPIGTIVKGSASVLETINIKNCHFPKLAKHMIAGLPKLNRIHLIQSSLSQVESGAFDDHPDFEIVDLSHNDLSSLPDGLFNKLKKLWFVDLEGNPRLIGSIDRSNFTHLRGGFNLKLPCNCVIHFDLEI